ncbi:helix-turn-helix domain-containing protein [Desulfosporosinus youngiae]|uniref:Putative transcription factor, MBF1 like protein n=1 Tax=Desulfosporosinus youngiae DSM 17734 TaxID=768710 RepID=H5Y408_9FIRM|nr:helix-turn-helix transcriptional regulator [Desulfosporosinus youngiae]EHQ89546.1 putative transcription factor, MBF1 like protein [Desulfosporosinus youngiae DSM 17734]
MNYGQRIKFFRNTVGISANALAKKIGLDPTTIYKIEANDSKPSLGSLESICAALGISLAEFFAEEEQAWGPEIQRLLGTVKKLSPEQIDYLQKLLESLSKE